MSDSSKDRTWQEGEARRDLTPENVRDLWSRTYNREGKPDWSHILPYYHEDVVFQDTVQRIVGKDRFVDMCNRLTGRCEQLNMDILSVVSDGQEIFIEWIMTMVFRRSPSTPVYGSSRLTLNDDGFIVSQRDYFDLWGAIFNGIPGFRRLYRSFMLRVFG